MRYNVKGKKKWRNSHVLTIKKEKEEYETISIHPTLLKIVSL